MSDRGFNIDRFKEGLTDRLLRFGGKKARIKRAVLRATSLAEPGPPKPKHIRTLSAFVAEAGGAATFFAELEKRPLGMQRSR